MSPNPCEGCRSARDITEVPVPHTCPEHLAAQAARGLAAVEAVVRLPAVRLPDLASKPAPFISFVADLSGEIF